MSSIALIHVAKRDLGLDDDTYRAALERITGKRYASKLSEAERRKVLDDFKAHGFNPSSNGNREALEGKFTKKLQALWIAGWNLGIVRNRDDKALLAFVKRQTGLDHSRFLHHADDGAKAIEALKAWLARDGGVDWSPWPGVETLMGHRIAAAQWFRISGDGAGFWPAVCTIAGHNSPALFQQESDWHPVMNELGRRIRAAKKAQD